MNTKTTILLFLILLFANTLVAQNGFQKNDIYLEAGGNGIAFSLNYERQLGRAPGLGLRMGVGVVPMVGLSIPAGINYLFKTKNEASFIEIGFGMTRLAGGKGKWEKIEQVNFVPGVGYRHHTNKNTMFRVSFTPVFNQSFVFPLVGFSIGKRF